MTDASDLGIWFRPHVTEQQDEHGEARPARYVRLKTGNKARRLANDTFVTELLITGRAADEVANEVMGAIADYASADPVWVEILDVGGNTIRAVKKIEPDREGDAPDSVAKLDPNSMMNALVIGITSSNATLNGRVSHLETALETSQNARVQLAERCGMSETLLIVEREKAAWVAEHSGDDEYNEALKLLSPLLAPLGGVLAAKVADMASGGGKKKATREPTPEDAPTPAATAGERADKAIAEVMDLMEKEPAVLRERTPQLMALGIQLQTLLTTAA